MAIFQVIKGTIECDECKKLLANVRWPKPLLDVAEQWAKHYKIVCIECEQKSTPKHTNI